VADLRRIIEIVFAGRDDLSPISQRTAIDFRSIATHAAAASAAVLALEAAQLALAKTLLTTGFEAAAKYEASLGNLTKVLDDQEMRVLPEIEATLKGLSAIYATSINDVLKSSAGWKAAGFDAQEAIRLTEATLRSMVVSDLNAEQATESLLKIIKGLELTAKDAIPVLDVFNKVSDTSGASNKQLFEAVSRIAPQAKLAGFSIQELTAFLTPGIEKFQSGAEVAEAFETTVGNLVQPTKDVSSALQTLGVSLTDSSGKARAIKDVLFDVERAYLKLNDSQKLVVAGQLAGTDQAARLAGILSDNTKTMELLTVANGAAGSSLTEFSKKAEQAQFSVAKLNSQFELLTIAMGQQFYKSAQGAITGITQTSAALEQALKAGRFDQFFGMITSNFKDIEVTAVQVAERLPEVFDRVDFSGFIQSTRAMWEAAFGEIATDPVERAVASIQSLVDALEGLNNFALVIGGAVRIGFNAITAGVKQVVLSVEEASSRLLLLKAAVFGVFGEPLPPDLVDDIAKLSVAMANTRESLLKDGEDIKAGWKALEDGASGLAGFIDKDLVPSFSRLRGLINEGGDVFKSTPFVSTLADWGASLDTFKDKVETSNPFNPVAESAKKAVEGVKKSVDEIDKQAQRANETLRILSDLAKEEIKARVTLDVASIQAQANVMIATINSVADQAKSAAAAVAAIGSQIGQQAQAAAGMAGSIASVLKEGGFSRESINIANRLISAMGQQLSLQQRSLGLQERELAIQERLERQTRELTEAQTEYLRAKAQRIASGKDINIKFDATAVTPALRQLLNETLAEIQAQATEDGAEFLIGVT